MLTAEVVRDMLKKAQNSKVIDCYEDSGTLTMCFEDKAGNHFFVEFDSITDKVEVFYE